jgi:hypothetical protein
MRVHVQGDRGQGRSMYPNARLCGAPTSWHRPAGTSFPRPRWVGPSRSATSKLWTHVSNSSISRGASPFKAEFVALAAGAVGSDAEADGPRLADLADENRRANSKDHVVAVSILHIDFEPLKGIRHRSTGHLRRHVGATQTDGWRGETGCACADAIGSAGDDGGKKDPVRVSLRSLTSCYRPTPACDATSLETSSSRVRGRDAERPGASTRGAAAGGVPAAASGCCCGCAAEVPCRKDLTSPLPSLPTPLSHTPSQPLFSSCRLTSASARAPPRTAV